MARSGGKGKLAAVVTPASGKSRSQAAPSGKPRVERRMFQATAGAAEQEQVQVIGDNERVLFSGSSAEFEALVLALKKATR